MLFNLNYYGFQTIEKAPFKISRPEGSPRYIFFHFTSSVNIVIDGKEISAPPGSCILYEPNVHQKFFVDYVNLNHDYLDFTCSDGNFFNQIRFPVNSIITPKISSFIISQIKLIHEESNANRLGTKYVIQCKMQDIFVSIARRIHNFSFNSADYEKTLQKEFEQIRLSMYHEPGKLKVKEMAKELDFSISHFTYLYKKFFNVTPIKDLTRARKDFIVSTNISEYKTIELAKKIGFDSTEYFYRWFKTSFGLTPAEYKKAKMKG